MILGLIVTMMPSLGFPQDEQPMKLVYFENYPPFSWKNDEGEMEGILIDVLTEAIRTHIGIPVTHTGYPWKHAQMLVQEGRADAFCTIPTDERRAYTDVSQEPVIVATFKAFTRANHPDLERMNAINTIADLKGFRIGHFLGAGWAKRNLHELDVNWLSSLDADLLNVERGLLDIHPGASEVVLFTVKQLGLKDKIIELPAVLDSQSFNLCIGKQSPFVTMLPQFDETMIQMRADGTLQQIYDRYR